MISWFALCEVSGSTNATPAWPSTSVTWLFTSMVGMSPRARYSSAFTDGGKMAVLSSCSMVPKSATSLLVWVAFAFG
jgi:hypothetical protein